MKYLLVLIIVLNGWTAASQVLIPRLGGSVSSIRLGQGFFAPDYKIQNRTGLVVGGEVQKMLSTKFGIACDLFYSQKGWTGKGTFNTVPLQDDIRLEYIDVGILPFFKFESFYLSAGPVLAIAVGGKSVQTQYWNNASLVYKNKPSFDNRFSVTAQASFGVIVLDKFVIDLAYQYFITDYFDSINDSASKLSSIKLTTGYLLRKKSG